METRQLHVRDLSTVTGIQQYEHCVQSIFFLGLEDFAGTIYLSIESNEFNEDVALTNNTFIIGQPMTKFNTTYTCQIYGIVGTGEKIQLSKQFRMMIDKSNNISGEAGEYPIDPNLVNGIDAYISTKETEIDEYVDGVIDSIPSDYTELEERVDALEETPINTAKLENGAVTWEKLSASLKSRISSAQGIGDQAIDLLIEILSNALYTSDQSSNIADLEEALRNSNADVIYQTGEVLTIEAVALEPYQSGETLIFE